MIIRLLSKRSSCKIEPFQYYEKTDLLPAYLRPDGGNRIYYEGHFKRLVFIRRSRELGFTIEEIPVLLQLVDSGNNACNDINEIALKHITGIQ